MTFKLPFGLKNGELVHVSEVEKGLDCGCVCLSCNHPLVARKGDVKIHHFAHHKGEECDIGLETALHLATKKILEKHKKIVLPESFVNMYEKAPDWRISEEKTLNIDEVKFETYKKGITPDILVNVQGKSLKIEITVPHKIGIEKIKKAREQGNSILELLYLENEKIKKAREQGISILELNFANYKRGFSIKDLENEIIYNISNKKWVLNIKAENLKKAAYIIAERKVFKGNIVPHCPKLHYSRLIETTNDLNEIPKLDWRDCAWCEFCFEMSYSEKKTAFCLFKHQIKNLNNLLDFLKENKKLTHKK